MTILDIHGYKPLYIDTNLSRSLKYFVKELKMRNFFVFLLLEVNTRLSFRMLSSLLNTQSEIYLKIIFRESHFLFKSFI